MISKAFSLKTLVAAGAVSLALAAALPAPAAQADVSVGIGFGVYPTAPAAAGWGAYGNGYDGYQGGYQGGYGGSYHRPPQPAYGGWVSCRDGRRILWRYGYSAIEVQSCRPGFYRYTAWRNGKHYLVAVDAQGDVSKLRRIY